MDIGEALSQNTSAIMFLYLLRNMISNVGIIALCHGVVKNTSVCFVDVSLNDFESDGLAALSRCIKACRHSGSPLKCIWVGDVRGEAGASGEVITQSTALFNNSADILNTFCTG